MKLFMNVINGCFILHADDHGMLRACAALYLNVALHFKQVFSTEGYVNLLRTVTNEIFVLKNVYCYVLVLVLLCIGVSVNIAMQCYAQVKIFCENICKFY